MLYKCESALITCEDFRLHQRKDGRNYMAGFIKKINSDCDLITRGGGIQDLVRTVNSGFPESLLRDIEVSVKLHQVSTIYLVNHEDCGAYGSMDFSTRDKEIVQHKKDLEDAKEIILEKFSIKNVKLYFAELQKGTADIFIIKEIG